MVPVLLLSVSAKAAGAERVHAALVRHLPSHGFAPTPVLFERGALEDWVAAAGFEATVLEARRTARPRAALGIIARLRRLIKRSDVRIVFSNQSNAHFYGGLAAAAARVPALWWQHGSAAPSLRERVAAAVPAAAIICSSDATRSAQERLAPKRRVETIYPGISLDAVRGARGRGAAIRKRLGWTSNPIVAIVGRLDPWKGQRTFLEAATLIGAERPDVRFAVVGGALEEETKTPYADELRALARSLGIADRIHFAGHAGDPYAWFDAIDIVVHASRGEPFGLVVVEAMALGKPVVCAADGGPLEIGREGECVLFASPRDAPAVAAAVCRILDEPGLAARLSRHARARADAFSEERMVEEFSSLLSDIRGGEAA